MRDLWCSMMTVKVWSLSVLHFPGQLLILQNLLFFSIKWSDKRTEKCDLTCLTFLGLHILKYPDFNTATQHGHGHAQLCSTLRLQTVTCQAPRPWNFPGKNTGAGCHFLLQGIFPTQGSNPCLFCLLHWQTGSLPAEPLGTQISWF